MYKDSNKWFVNSELNQFFRNSPQPIVPRQILEIGVYEGMSTTHILDFLCQHKDSRMFAVDPFVYNTLLNFYHNVNLSKHVDKLTLKTETSDEFFEKNRRTYDFIYIDGDHAPEQVEKDLRNSWEVLRYDGMIWMDDYEGGQEGCKDIKNTIDRVVKELDCEIIHKGYQLAIKKNVKI